MTEPKVPKQRSWLYIFVYLVLYEGLMSGAISGGINFAISYGMYAKRSRQVTLWRFPHTMSGDCAVTLFVQTVLTHIIEEIMVGWDCYTGDTFYFPSLPLGGRLNKWAFKALEVDRGMVPFGLRPEAKEGAKPTFKGYVKQLITYDENRSNFVNFIICAVHKVILALLIAIPIWFVEWPVTMGVLAGIGKYIGGIEYELGNYPKPQVIKLVYTVILGWVSTPISIAAVMLRNQWYVEYYSGNNQVLNGENAKLFDLEKTKKDNEKIVKNTDTSSSSESDE
ncbi:hypothetical protein TPHA_0F00280 [Tetrapisispora phaffii CBS 4417]|uniref:Uncharacterized protein n=1 Tax=Tetrapisispora phaffii (strain ATCC 24235 / CBS 4417 / NBRC 1672 / NRRL Y-8282 / UCD 70-5) TaxID=1071381 RepID=G8BUT3_TETPH|nr:hypothetical protein TPHA_0F00280 [Tetrapisispora phaffii CBS 4417]CCE63515.1 hypothetical protein TPHA_0F00280 [Tetrapisispora phaffii CBS 4417]